MQKKVMHVSFCDLHSAVVPVDIQGGPKKLDLFERW